MYAKILLPLDGSQVAESILPYVRTLAKALKLPVELLQVIDPESVRTFVNPERGMYLDVVENDLKRTARDYLKNVAKSFGSSSSAEQTVEFGRPAEIIVDRAAANEKTLIAMSTHGRSGIQRWYLGSVADKVLHASKDPMLLVRADEKTKPEMQAPLGKLIVPLDGSPLAEVALPHATALAKSTGVAIELLRVYTLLTQAYYGEGFMPDYEQLTDAIKSEAMGYLEEKASQLRAEGIKNVSCVLKEGDAAAQIIELAQKTPDSLITMCTHGRSGIGRWVLGGNADRVIRHSGDPVLVVRASD